MGFAIRFENRDYPIGEGKFIVGRSESCQLVLEDPMASRNHASFSIQGEELWLDDLESRNGVFVNDEKVEGRRLLGHGDKVRIGSQNMVVLRRGGMRTDTLVQAPVTERLQAFGVLGGLAEKALAMGNGGEAERILGRQLETLLEQAERREQLERVLFTKVSGYALRIATTSRKAKWMDFLFRLYAAHGELMDAETVNELYGLSRKVTGASRAHLRAYVASLAPKAANFGAGERFLLGRLEGLEALLN
ncbi:MAG TPA: FHA domain-containing protein [Polyangiaceae bacterium]|nr:FHA domain-containing protein [Polyangiaceae bacterium]